MKSIVILGVFTATVFATSINGAQRKFPIHFKFGAATSAYQVEGAWNKDGKGENIWDEFTHSNQNLILDGTNGDESCNSYKLYKRDVKLLKNLGVDYYRFSLSWSRILPTGFTNAINYAGVDYYRNLIKELKTNGIAPVVTLYHWDLPLPLQRLGGWANPLIADYFEGYVKLVFKLFGDDVSDWITFNEPHALCLGGYGGIFFAPGINMPGIGEYQCGHNLLKSHARAYHVYDTEFKPTQNGRLTIAINSMYYLPGSDSQENKTAGEKTMQFEIGWFAHPIYSEEGDYPKMMKEAIGQRSKEQGYPKSRLPVFTPEEIEYIKGTYDFFGLNHYTTRIVKPISSDKVIYTPSYEDDLGVEKYTDDSWESAESTWIKVVPWGFRKVLNWVKERYNNPEVVICENGFSDKGELDDAKKIDYYKGYLNALLDAIDDGCTISGYTIWSLLDNFEWNSGYVKHFGLHAVDLNSPNKTRTPKASAKFYHDVIKNRKIV